MLSKLFAVREVHLAYDTTRTKGHAGAAAVQRIVKRIINQGMTAAARNDKPGRVLYLRNGTSHTNISWFQKISIQPRGLRLSYCFHAPLSPFPPEGLTKGIYMLDRQTS